MTETGFTAAQRSGIMMREGEMCALCKRRAEEVNHRLNRGSGGSKLRNTTDNGCALCRACNRRIESDAALAAEARRLGVKLREGDDPARIPIFLRFYGQWCRLIGDDCWLTGIMDATLDAHVLAGELPDLATT